MGLAPDSERAGPRQCHDAHTRSIMIDEGAEHPGRGSLIYKHAQRVTTAQLPSGSLQGAGPGEKSAVTIIFTASRLIYAEGAATTLDVWQGQLALPAEIPRKGSGLEHEAETLTSTIVYG